MKKLTIIAVIVSFLMISGCASRQTSLLLNDVESYIMERPDSALAVLDTMDRAHLSTDRLKAHHALLHAMALDKNYIDVTDDSLASVAVRYYSKHGPKKYLARSLYYKGLSYYYNKEYDKSIIEFSKAESIAEVHDSLYLGFVKVLQADIYSTNYNWIGEIESLENALEIYKSLNVDYYIDVAQLRLAQAYIGEGRYEEAESMLKSLIHSGTLNQRMNAKAISSYAFLMGTRPDADYKTAVNYFEKTAEVEDGKHLSKQDYWVWAHALAQTGDLDRSQQIVDMLSSIDTSGTAYYWQYKIAKAQNKTSEAFTLHQKFSDKNNEEVIKALKQSISVVQRDYYQSQYELSEYKTKVNNIILYCIILVAVSAITLIYITARQYKRKKEFELEEYIRYAEEINRQLQNLHAEAYTSLQKKYLSTYRARYEIISSLFEQYVLSRGRKSAESSVYRQVTVLIDNLRKDIASQEDLERTLNSDLGDIMTMFKTELPKLRKKDHQLFGYLALGFDITVISHFMGCTQNTLYIRKSRLKKHIEESDSEYKNEYLQIIS